MNTGAGLADAGIKADQLSLRLLMGGGDFISERLGLFDFGICGVVGLARNCAFSDEVTKALKVSHGEVEISLCGGNIGILGRHAALLDFLVSFKAQDLGLLHLNLRFTFSDPGEEVPVIDRDQ